MATIDCICQHLYSLYLYFTYNTLLCPANLKFVMTAPVCRMWRKFQNPASRKILMIPTVTMMTTAYKIWRAGWLKKRNDRITHDGLDLTFTNYKRFGPYRLSSIKDNSN